MCGITGALARETDQAALVERMTHALRHRGPDARGLWSDDLCVLGHARLAIIDLSAQGRQPLSNEDGTVWITFNGEIYNFDRLREELEGLGHQFRSRTDTEAIVHAYEQWGMGCVSRLRGMFAFGIWDQRRRRLFLARDRVGKKPLFYCRRGDTLHFASELQALLEDETLPREVDLAAIDAYLTWGYVPAPRTGFRGIAKLPPGHWMTAEMTPEGLELRTERYWRLEHRDKLPMGEEAACRVLREKLTEAVRLRMVSDVPLGAFLSGGIDSSIVVGLMAELSGSPVQTFSIGFEDARFDELEHARRVAERWGADHHELVVRPDAAAILPTLVRHYGEPYADSSAIPTYYVAQMTRQSVTVALNGDGGDESFAGYKRYWAGQVAETVRRVPGSRPAAELLRRLLPDVAHSKSRLRLLHRFLAAAHQPMSERYVTWVGYVDEPSKHALYGGELRAVLAGAERPIDWLNELLAEAEGLDAADAAMAVDIRSYLPYDLLVKVDITAMAHGLEARSPFLDHEVMEFAARLPIAMKLRGGRTKHLLKRAFADLLPAANVRRGKMGFCAPVGEWLRNELRELLCDSLLRGRLVTAGFLRSGPLQQLVQQHLNSQADHSQSLWALLMWELWHREMLEARPTAARREPASLAPVT